MHICQHAPLGHGKAIFLDAPEAGEAWADARCDDLEQGRLDGLLVTLGTHADSVSTAKVAVGARLEQSGMRWTVGGANAPLALRCCLLSGAYEDHWAQRAATAEVSK